MASKRRQLAICVDNVGYEASLELRKVYRVIPDSGAQRKKLVRIVDESGEDYLYPKDFFEVVRISAKASDRVLRTLEPAK